MKKYIILFYLMLFGAVLHGTGATSSPREVLRMNNDWAFYRGEVKEGARADLDDSSWMTVVLPHIMQLEKKHCGGNAIYDGIGWYRR